MDFERERRSAGPGLINAGSQSSNVNPGAGNVISGAFSLSDLGSHLHYHPPDPQRQRYYNDNGHHLPHQPSEPLPMSDTSTRSTPSTGLSSLSEAHASGLDPTRSPPIGTTKPLHRNPYQYVQSHSNPVPSNPPRSSSQDQLKKPVGGGPTISPPFLHPLSLRTKASRAHSPFPTQRSRGGQKPRTKFAVGSSPPNSPVESEPEQGHPTPKLTSSPFTIRGFLALSTLSKVVAVLFACCVFLLLRAFLGIGHSAEGCGVYAHEVAGSGPGSGFPSGGSGSGLDIGDPKLLAKDENSLDRMGGEGQTRVWLERVEEVNRYRHDRKLEEYEIEYGGDGGDRYDDEYEHEDFLGQA